MSKPPPLVHWDFEDWQRDTIGLSLEAAGLWIRLLVLMNRAPRRGYLLTQAGKPFSLEQLASHTGCSTDTVSRLLRELEDAGVYSTTSSGVRFSRRMVRDESKRRKCSDAGKRGGGNPLLRDATFKGPAKGPPKVPPNAAEFDTREKDPDFCFRLSSDPEAEDKLRRSHFLAEQIYEHYPRKVGHKRALRAIAKALEAESFAVLLAAVKEFAQSRAGNAGRFTPHPTTWFNQERWRDDRSLWNERHDEVADELHRSLDEAGAILRRLQGDDGRPV
jgi:DNA-binding Lrp family transcriptional regulator